jgi:hypothetical protein
MPDCLFAPSHRLCVVPRASSDTASGFLERGAPLIGENTHQVSRIVVVEDTLRQHTIQYSDWDAAGPTLANEKLLPENLRRRLLPPPGQPQCAPTLHEASFSQRRDAPNLWQTKHSHVIPRRSAIADLSIERAKRSRCRVV